MKKSATIKAAWIVALFTLGAAIISPLINSWLGSKPSVQLKTEGELSPASITTGSNSPIHNYYGDVTFSSSDLASKEIKTYIDHTLVKKENKIELRISGKLINPEEGKIYTSYAVNGAKFQYMLKSNKIHLDYTAPNNEFTAYYVIDKYGNILDQKFPYKLEEYSIIIPEDLVLEKSSSLLPNGYTKIVFKLKWGSSGYMIYDNDNKLKKLDFKGEVKISHTDKTIILGKDKK